MKRWFLHTLLLVALSGHLGHSFFHTHDIHHVMYEEHEDGEGSYEQCTICTIEDHMVATHDHIRSCRECLETEKIEIRQADVYAHSITPTYSSRAPPSLLI